MDNQDHVGVEAHYLNPEPPGPVMLEMHRKILDRLNTYHVGVDNSISMPDLAAAMGCGTRTLQDFINELVVHFGAPISSGLPCGYFIIVDPKHGYQSSHNLWRRSLSNIERARALIKNMNRDPDLSARIDALTGQLRLEFDKIKEQAAAEAVAAEPPLETGA